MTWTIVSATSFLNDMASLPTKARGRVESFVFELLPAAENPIKIGKLQKLKGYKDFYKVRFGDYRLGLQLDSHRKQVHLLRVMHRRNIYRHFP